MSKTPLRVALVFHPDSDASREMARFLHRSLNEDALVPGLRIPTIFCPETAPDPPSLPGLDDAERTFVVVLADEYLNASEEWCSFVAELYGQCGDTRHRFFPVQLEEHAWPLHDTLRSVSFARSHLEEEGPERNEHVLRALLVELCRFLEGHELGGDGRKTSTTVFLSHAKADIEREPRVVESLRDHLARDQPVEAWIDSGNIEVGSTFSEAIRDGVRETSMLCVLTDSYATREWCREEVLTAKEFDRPAIIVDALVEHEVRTFPYLGNLPRVRWDGNPARIVDLLLKETLRYLHDRELLEHYRQEGDRLLLRPPEAATLVGLAQPSTVLYPDPPIGLGEKRLVAPLGHTLETPLERLAKRAELCDRMLAISMSEGSHIEREGLDPVHQDQISLEICRHLLIAGATLAYGGHLGSEGYTEKLCELVRAHNGRTNVSPVELIQNFIGWPVPRPDAKKQSEFKNRARLRVLGRPEGVDETLHPDFEESPAFFPAELSVLHRYAWSRGMTEMREIQSDETVARIILGGKYDPTITALPDGTKKEKWYMSRIPGVLEEALLTLKKGKPIFLVGAFGGVGRLLVDVLRGREPEEMTWEFQKKAPHAEELRELYREHGEEWWDYPEMIAFLRERGVAGINPHLEPTEHEELFDCRDPHRIVELILTGLARMT